MTDLLPSSAQSGNVLRAGVKGDGLVRDGRLVRATGTTTDDPGWLNKALNN